MPLQARFDDEIRKHFSKGARLLAAVSGGADSICLAELLDGCGDIEFSLVHCNFHLRGEESDADEMSVREWASRHGRRLFVEHFDTCSYAGENGISIEMAARELRYRRFGEICTTQGFDAVVTAHNANDNAETLVLNLLRGTGLRGLAGMEAESPLPCCSVRISLVRPMLGFSRKEIEDFLVLRHVGWRNDSSNTDIAYKRNRVRNRIFPEFAEINPSFIHTLNEDMRRFAQARDMLDSWYDSIKDSFMEETEDGAAIRLKEIARDRSLRYIMFRSLERYGFSQDCCNRISTMIEDDDIRSGRIFHAGTYVGIIDKDVLVIRKKSSAKMESAEIDGEGTYLFGKGRLAISLAHDIPAKLSMTDGIVCDASKLPFPFTLRGWKDGDWISPLGMNGRRKKLSDLFKDDGVGISERPSTACIAIGSHVLAIPETGRIDEAIKIDGGTTEVLKIRIEK